MKRILFIVLLALSFSAKSQTVIDITDNPAILSPGTTDVVYYRFPIGTFPDSYEKTIFYYFPSSNGSTVQVNFRRNLFTNSPAFAGSDSKVFFSDVKNGGGFFFKALTGTDQIIIFW